MNINKIKKWAWYILLFDHFTIRTICYSYNLLFTISKIKQKYIFLLFVQFTILLLLFKKDSI